MRYVILNEDWKTKAFDKYDSYYIVRCSKGKFVFLPSDIIEGSCSHITIDRDEGTYKLFNVPLEIQNDENFKKELNDFLKIDIGEPNLQPEESMYYQKKREELKKKTQSNIHQQ